MSKCCLLEDEARGTEQPRLHACLVTRLTLKLPGVATWQESNPRSLDRNFDALTITPVSHQSAATKTRINHYNYRTVLLSTTRHQNHTARRRDISASVSLWSVTLLLAANYLQSKLRRYTVQKKTN